MYQNIYVKRTKTSSEIHLWDDKIGYSKLQYKPYAYRKSTYGKLVALDGKTVEKVYNPGEEQGLYENDLNPEMRTLIDMYTDSDEASVGHIPLFIDIEVDIESGFPTPEKAENEVTSIAIFDEAGDQRCVWILDKDRVVENVNKPGYEVISCSDERILLSRFLNKYQEIRPTIINGWNIDFFDIPYLYNRMVKII